jgi:hypothetical protein
MITKVNEVRVSLSALEGWKTIINEHDKESLNSLHKIKLINEETPFLGQHIIKFYMSQVWVESDSNELVSAYRWCHPEETESQIKALKDSISKKVKMRYNLVKQLYEKI